MPFLHNIRLKIANYQLKQDLKNRFRKRDNLDFNKALTIGLLFDPTEESDFDLIKKFIKYIREHKKQVKSIGYFNLKQVPTMEYSKLEYDFIAEKELNFFYKPTDSYIPAFLDEEFDILINLDLKNHWPLRYLAAMSKAKCKIGPYAPGDESIYDLMLNVDESRNLKYYFKQIDHYLNLINKPHEQS